MKLSREEKDKLADHYRGKDLYDPANAPEQEPPNFKPQPLCHGGEAHMDEGGDPGDFNGPSLSGDTDTVKGSPISALKEETAPQMPVIAPKTASPLPQAATLAPKAAPVAQTAQIAPQAAPGATKTAGLQPDQWDSLVKALSAKPTLGQSAMSGLAGLADAIETGVARAPGPGFQKQIMEQQQNQKQNLINALREKYEAGYKGKTLAQGQERISEEERAHRAEETQRAADLAVAKEAHRAEAGHLANEAQNKALEDSLAVMKQAHIWSPEYAAAKAKVQALTKGGGAAPMTATNKAGHKIVSVDGGKTWKPMQ